MECETDTDCLLSFTVDNIKLLQVTYGDFKNPEKLAQFRAQLEKLAKIIKDLYPSTATQRGTFVNYTGIFKKFYIQGKFTEDDRNAHISVVKDILHANKSDVIAYLQKKDARLTERLKDKFDEVYDDVARKVNKMFTLGMDPDCNKKDSIQLLLAAMCCAGMRKGAILDPSCKFYTYDNYTEKLARKGLSQPTMRIGIWASATVPDEEYSFEVLSKGVYKEQFGEFAYTIVQVGVLKDKSQNINKYLLDKEDARYVENKVLVKPTIILTSAQIVQAITRFREINNINEETFRDRKRQGNKFSTRLLQPFMMHYFPRAFALAAKHNWEFSSHYCRKFYANASWEVYQEKIRLVTNKYVDKSVFCANVLGHGGGLSTSLSYMNLFVKFNFDAIEFKIPPAELYRNIVLKNEELKRQIEDFQAYVKKEIQTIALERPKVDNEALFVIDETEIVLTKKRKHVDPDADIRKVIADLKSKRIPVTSNNIKKTGFGRLAIQQFAKRFPSEAQWVKSDETKDELDSKHNDDDDATTSPKAKKPKSLEAVEAPKHPLPKTVKIIIPQHGSKAANLEVKRRDEMTYGKENTLLDPKDCTGTIVKNVKHGPKKIRDECHSTYFLQLHFLLEVFLTNVQTTVLQCSQRPLILLPVCTLLVIETRFRHRRQYPSFICFFFHKLKIIRFF